MQTLLDLLSRHSFQHAVYIEVGRDEDLTVSKHVDHILVRDAEIVDRDLKRVATAFEAFDKPRFPNSRQAAAGALRIVVPPLGDLRLQVGNRAVARVG